MAALATPGSQACTATTIRWRLGSGWWDPFVKYTVDQVATWIDLWNDREVPGIRLELRRSWHQALSEIYLANKHLSHFVKKTFFSNKGFYDSCVDWKKVNGPISATVAALLRARWRPSAPDCWATRDGTQAVHIDDDRYVKHHVLAEIQSDLEDIAWVQAAHHYLGGGVGAGNTGPGSRTESPSAPAQGPTKAARSPRSCSVRGCMAPRPTWPPPHLPLLR